MINKIYIVAFKRVVTGGTESLHQLVNMINQGGKQAKIFYIDEPGAMVPEKFQKYHVESANEIEDIRDNWIIVPECRAEFLKQFYKIRKCIWWLSLDYYLARYPIYRCLGVCKRRNIPQIFLPIIWIFLFMKGRLNFDYLNISQMGDILHLYNCEYVHEYLLKHHISEKKMMFLCGPISEEYFEEKINFSEKENIILYNPAKDFKFASKVIKVLKKSRKDVQIYPIKNMSSQEIISLMKRAKVYMDFGTFPGPERIPREAVMLGCNIITSCRGSAANRSDVLIDDMYKFKVKKKNIYNIVNTINELLDQYEMHYSEYDAYRKKVINQRISFKESVNMMVQIMQKT